jgi:hypothetical protein
MPEDGMKASRIFGAVLTLGLGLAMVGAGGDALAQNKKPPAKKEPAAAPVAAEPPMAKKPMVIEPTGLAWGMDHKAVAAVYDKQFDDDYKPKYKSVSPGVKMKALDSALAEEKAVFRRSRIDFGKIPTGLDGTPLKGEFTYNNGESMMSVTRNGQTRYLFFIKGKLWKVVDEIKLAEGTPYGKDFQSAVVKQATALGTPGRVLPPDAAKGRPMPEVDWKDSSSHIRAVQRSNTAFALILEDNVTLGNLASLRTNKPAEDSGIDPSVAAIMGGQSAPPGPPEGDKGKPPPKEKKPPPPPKK